MNLELAGKTALVTGASKGIGRAIALALAAEGATVIGVARDGDRLAELLATLGGPEKGHRAVPLDLVEPGAEQHLVDWLSAEGLAIDILVHNLGGSLDIRDPLCSGEDWSRLWRYNFEVAATLNGLLVPAMQAGGWGRVLHVSSISALENSGPVSYCTLKAALTAYSRSLGRVLARDGIVVAALLPGAVYSEGGPWERAAQERPERVAKLLDEELPTGRFAQPEEVARAAAFLCSPLASQCVGAVLQVDGGMGRAFA